MSVAENRAQMPESSRIFDEFRRVFGVPAYVSMTENGRTLEWGRRIDREVPPIPLPRPPIE